MPMIDSARMRDLLRVYFIAGSMNCLKDPEVVLEEAIAGGITLFQFREKGTGSLEGEEKKILAGKLHQICKAHNIPFIVNDDVELAIELDADGVHVGQEDAEAGGVRKRIGDKILGVSVHSEKEARLALEAGADYVGIGPVFTTKTKEDAKPERGTGLIEQLRATGYEVPIVGIGGITVGNAASVIKAGADGVSVISAISLAENPIQAAQELANQVEQGGLALCEKHRN
ncbi:thiamine phosphate synthase [Bacillus sp. FJAT-27245]|uniref:thiamine phosphate synthase n=1 Tax=Bacillus sp. FJAT-27245 TaxID=1684144 RepID=UPI0006A7DCBC|nr:thiamine phosphate synthase [Bacillus sp. FJAT-27245]